MNPMKESATPAQMAISATLNTGKSMKSVAKKSTTYPSVTRSSAFPSAPPATSERPRTSSLETCGERARYTAMATVTTSANRANMRPMPSPRLNAAPVFATKRRLKTPGMTGTLSPVTMRVFLTNTLLM